MEKKEEHVPLSRTAVDEEKLKRILGGKKVPVPVAAFQSSI